MAQHILRHLKHVRLWNSRPYIYTHLPNNHSETGILHLISNAFHVRASYMPYHHVKSTNHSDGMNGLAWAPYP